MDSDTAGDSSQRLTRFAYGAQIVLGVLIALLSRTTWVEVAWVNYRGTDDWYGRVVILAGILTAAIGVAGLTNRLSGATAIWSSLLGLIFSTCAVVITVLVGLRTRQIAADIKSKARAPERWFEDTLLEGVGRAFANIGESVSDTIQPNLSTTWRFLLVAAVIATLVSASASWSLWRAHQNESDNQPFSPEFPN